MTGTTAAGSSPRVEPADGLADIPGLVAGTTVRVPGGGRGREDDFGLSTGGPALAVAARYARLGRELGFRVVAVCRQVHGTRVVAAGGAPEAGLWIPGEADGFAGRFPGCLFAVTVADCVPVTLVDADAGAIALVHAGWRGAAAGILSRAVEALAADGARVDRLRVHLGPAICGSCYEVGPEVPRAFGRQSEGKSHLDVRDELTREAAALGIPAARVSRSPACTRCDGERFHSHRGAGDRAGRMAAYVGWREEAGARMFGG